MIYTCFDCSQFGEIYVRPYLGPHFWFYCKNCQKNTKLHKYKLKTAYEIKEVLQMSKLLTVKDLAIRYKKSDSYIRFLVYRGYIPFYEVMGHIKFREKDLPDIDYYMKNFSGVRGRKKLKKGGDADETKRR